MIAETQAGQGFQRTVRTTANGEYERIVNERLLKVKAVMITYSVYEPEAIADIGRLLRRSR